MSGFTRDTRVVVEGSVQMSSGTGLDLEAVVREAASALSEADRAALAASGEETAERTAIGAKLDALVTRALRRVAPGNGWVIHANRRLSSFPGLDAATCARTIEEFVHNELRWYEDELRPLFVTRASGSKRLVGNLRPDLVIQDPTTLLTIWDLTSRESAAHLAKTILYSHVLSRGRFRCRIGETFWAGLKA